MAGAPSLPQLISVQKAAGTLYNNYTTAKSILNTGDLFRLPGNYLQAGSVFKLKARGGLSNVVTTPGNVFFQIMVGSVIAWTTGNLALNATARTLLPFTLDVDFRVDSIGSGTSAKIMGMGSFGGVHLTNTDAMTNVPTTAPTLGTGFDAYTPSGDIDLFCGFSNAQSGNGVQLQTFELWQIAGFSQ